jgi:hypothetical protein
VAASNVAAGTLRNPGHHVAHQNNLSVQDQGHNHRILVQAKEGQQQDEQGDAGNGVQHAQHAQNGRSNTLRAQQHHAQGQGNAGGDEQGGDRHEQMLPQQSQDDVWPTENVFHKNYW